MFNTLQYAKKLEDVGFSRSQAEAQVLILTEIIEGDVATKQDIKDLEFKLLALEHRLVIKLSAVMGSMITIGIGIAVAIAKLV